MKNRPSLSLVMGRRTKSNNKPITKQDHKDILSSSTPERWWVCTLAGTIYHLEMIGQSMKHALYSFRHVHGLTIVAKHLHSLRVYITYKLFFFGFYTKNITYTYMLYIPAETLDFIYMLTM